MKRASDLVTLVAGVAILALGAVLTLDQSGSLELTFGWLGAALAAVFGTILLVSGLSE